VALAARAGKHRHSAEQHDRESPRKALPTDGANSLIGATESARSIASYGDRVRPLERGRFN